MLRLRVATYNVHGGVGRDGRCDPHRIAQVLNEANADVVALQEVDLHRGPRDMLALLARHTGLDPVAGATMLKKTGAFGNALLTRFRPIAVRRVDLSVPHREPRGALDVVVACRGIRLRVLATHLGLRPAERRLQVRRVLTRLESEPTRPVVLMGDLNEWFLWGRPLRWLHRVFDKTPAPATYPARFPLFALDRLWVEPRHVLDKIEVHSSPLARRASDHLPLLAELEIGADTGPVAASG